MVKIPGGQGGRQSLAFLAELLNLQKREKAKVIPSSLLRWWGGWWWQQLVAWRSGAQERDPTVGWAAGRQEVQLHAYCFRVAEA